MEKHRLHQRKRLKKTTAIKDKVYANERIIAIFRRLKKEQQ